MSRVRVAEVSEGRLPTVTVVIPCYNYARYLAGAVASAAEQPGVDVEIIIVDDASTDGSVEVAERLAAADARISVVTNDVNRGHIATYNVGLALASGDYVVLLSADDLLAEGSLGRAARLMDTYPRVGLVYGYAENFTVEPPAPRRGAAGSRAETWSVWRGSEWVTRMCERGSNTIVNPEAMVRRTVLEETGLYDPDLPQTADMMLWMRCATVGDVGRVNGRVQGYYRVHGENMHLTTLAGDFRELVARADTFASFFEAIGQLNDRRLDTARQSLSREALRRAVELVSHDRDSAEAAVYAGFAESLWPVVVEQRPWRIYQSRRATRVHPAVSLLEHQRERARAIARWRRWRRYGT